MQAILRPWITEIKTARYPSRHLPLHGAVFAIKDQLDTYDMRTTSGADVAYANDRPPRDATVVKRLREQRPGADFVISLRYGWDGKDDDALRARLAGYRASGIEHVLLEPAERTLDDWLRAVERAARAAEL